MAIISRDFPDLLLDAVVSALEDFRDSEVAQSAAVTFAIERDRLRPLFEADGPTVNVWIDEDLPDEQRSGAREIGHTTVAVNIDLVAMARGTDDQRADKAAMTRLHYLRAQVRHGLYALINADFGFGEGVIAKKNWPRWQTFQTEDKMAEISAPAGRLVMEIEYEWTPEDIDVVPLNQIQVADSNLELWDTVFDLGGS